MYHFPRQTASSPTCSPRSRGCSGRHGWSMRPSGHLSPNACGRSHRRHTAPRLALVGLGSDLRAVPGEHGGRGEQGQRWDGGQERSGDPCDVGDLGGGPATTEAMSGLPMRSMPARPAQLPRLGSSAGEVHALRRARGVAGDTFLVGFFQLDRSRVARVFTIARRHPEVSGSLPAACSSGRSAT